MTKKQLHFAQFLQGVYERAHYFIDQKGIEPRDDYYRPDVERSLLAMAGSAKGLFMELTGLSPLEVESHELNTESPAEWTKLAGNKAFPKTAEAKARKSELAEE